MPDIEPVGFTVDYEPIEDTEPWLGYWLGSTSVVIILTWGYAIVTLYF